VAAATQAAIKVLNEARKWGAVEQADVISKLPRKDPNQIMYRYLSPAGMATTAVNGWAANRFITPTFYWDADTATKELSLPVNILNPGTNTIDPFTAPREFGTAAVPCPAEYRLSPKPAAPLFGQPGGGIEGQTNVPIPVTRPIISFPLISWSTMRGLAKTAYNAVMKGLGF
jgi:hypothetical protein